MPRRVIQALRITLVVLGFCVLALWPMSYVGMPVLRMPLPSTNGAAVAFERGIAMIGVDLAGPRHRRGVERVEASLSPLSDPSTRVPPTFDARWSGGKIAAACPLWLLAAICLAWPVTSMLLARRGRKGRGFEIEVRDQKSEVSQRAEDAASKPSDL
jgi:hypothetical protein